MLEREIERGVRVPVDGGLFDWEAGGESWGAAIVEANRGESRGIEGEKY